MDVHILYVLECRHYADGPWTSYVMGLYSTEEKALQALQMEIDKGYDPEYVEFTLGVMKVDE